jgi:FtsZ-binding cell division protein ZapB
MATSADSRHRSRLIREMARDLNRHDHSCASSTGSHHGTVSDDSTIDFDPENEAIMSTRQIDLNFSQKLPELRDTAKKYGRWNGNKQTNDFIINTSAIGRAFPDFSQGGSSDESSFHIEVGRGAKSKQRAPSRVPRTEYSDNINSPVVSIGDFKILSTPPSKGQSKSPRPNSLRNEWQSKGASTPQKENIPPPAVPTASEMPNYVSGATRSSSGEQRRTLAEIHARVADDSDGSFISDERPATVTFQPKQSRFSTTQPKGSPLSAIHHIPQQQIKNALADAISGHRNVSQQTPFRPQNVTQNSNTVNQTNQSFLLPNMPDLSELVSGSFKDGTPVFTRSGKVQSRFASGKTPPGPMHTKLDNIPVPDEEKAIFISLQLLQDKVAMLEMEKADAQRVAQNLQDDNYQLQSENAQLQKHRRSDSALGMADSGSDGEYGQGNKNLLAEKTS